MRFSVFVTRPVLALMINLAMLAAGLFAYTRLNVESMPQINMAVVTIETRLEGASPELIESQITRPIEDAVAILPGLDNINSTCEVGQSSVMVQFTVGTDGNAALQQCRDKVEAIANQFPQGTLPSSFIQFSSQDQAIMTLAVRSRRPIRQLTELAQYSLAQKLQTISGVGEVEISGGQKRQVRIFVDSDRLEEVNLSINTVVSALRSHNVQIPGGTIRSHSNQYLLTVDGKLDRVQQFADIVIDTSLDQNQNSQEQHLRVVRLGDVAEVLDSQEEATSFSRLNGEPIVTLDIKKTADANLLNVVSGVTDRLDALKATLPSDVELEVVRDNSVVIKQSVQDLKMDLILGAGLACLTVLIFLRSFRLTVIAGVAIPISLIATLAIMAALNYTLNYMTLLALSLAVGIVVDDAVVVLENISTQLEQNPGMSPSEAASLGVGEIAFAVVATTLSLVVLFLPLAFMPGVIGMYFRSWGITMAVAILLSMVVSFTLTPMLCSRWLKVSSARIERGPDPWYQRAYLKVLKVSLRFRWLLVLASLGVFITSGPLLATIGKEFTTPEDQGDFTVNLKLPHSWTLQRMAEELRPLERDLQELPHVAAVLTTCNQSSASVYVKLKPYSQRQPYTVFRSAQAARDKLKRYKLFRPAVSLGSASGYAFEFTLLGEDLDILRRLAEGIRNKLETMPGVEDLDLSLQPTQPEIEVNFDPDRAAALGVDVQQAGDAIQAAVAGLKVSTFQEGSHGYDVRVQLLPEQRSQPHDVQRLLVPSQRAPSGQVTLDQVADVGLHQAAAGIQRYQRQRKVSVQANLAPPANLQSAYMAAQDALKQLKPPPGYGPVQTGDSKLMAETALAAFQSFLLSVMFMYMVMASQFENLMEPVLILLTLPLAIPFALASLIAAGMTLNLFSVLGLFLLFGVVKKNAILQIDRTNQLRAAGMSPREAILEANRDRLRPILMTTLTLVVAMIPVAFGGPTGAMRAPMAMVVVGGQSLCLLLTLVIVPAATSILEDISGLWRRFFAKEVKA